MNVADAAIRRSLVLPGHRGNVSAMKMHGRSFHWASRLLGREQSKAVEELYAFCRYVDDVADQPDIFRARETLDSIVEELRQEDSAKPVIAAFVRLVRQYDIDRKLPRLLLLSLRKDIGPVRIQDWQELMKYAYGVASTVGLMMCAVLGVRDPRGWAHAVDLGIAMQLTNIARDVLEDAGRGRVYLPDTACPEATATAIITGNQAARRSAYRAVLDVLDCAAVYYRSADAGMGYLPWRARLAVLTASRLYEAIGTEIRRSPDSYWHRRAVVGRRAKLRHTARAMTRLGVDPGYWRAGSAKTHDPGLHTALAGLPGVNG